jgi:transcriptional regulator with XRE-family HTH domain
VPRVDALHRVIGKDLCCKKPSLFNPKEIKFLRKELHLKSKELARALGVAPETVSRWENNKSPISESEDRLFRTLYMMFVSEQADEVLHHDVLKLFSGLPRGRKKATRTKKIELSPVDWMDKHQPQFCSA